MAIIVATHEQLSVPIPNQAVLRYEPLPTNWPLSGIIIQDLAIFCEQPSPPATPNGPLPWKPYSYPNLDPDGVHALDRTQPIPATIQISAADVFVHRIFLLNPTVGISISNPTGLTSSVGRVTLDHIWGQPLFRGIVCDNVGDVMKVHNVHFNLFWSTNQSVKSYQQANSTVIHSFRNDAPYFSNIFGIPYLNGFWFDESLAQANGTTAGSTGRFVISNAYFDQSARAIYVTGRCTTGQGVNIDQTGWGTQATPSDPWAATNGQWSPYVAPMTPDAGIEITDTASDCHIHLSNVRVTNHLASAVINVGPDSYLSFSSLWVENFNQDHSNQYAAIFQGNGAVAIDIAHCLFTSSMDLSPGFTGTVNIATQRFLKLYSVVSGNAGGPTPNFGNWDGTRYSPS